MQLSVSILTLLVPHKRVVLHIRYPGGGGGGGVGVIWARET